MRGADRKSPPPSPRGRPNPAPPQPALHASHTFKPSVIPAADAGGKPSPPPHQLERAYHEHAGLSTKAKAESLRDDLQLPTSYTVMQVADVAAEQLGLSASLSLKEKLDRAFLDLGLGDPHAMGMPAAALVGR